MGSIRYTIDSKVEVYMRKNILKKQGFTLVELLAVIVILAIILLIAVPSIMGVVNRAKKDAFKNDLISVIKATQLYETKNNFTPIPDEGLNITSKIIPLDNDDKFVSGLIKKVNGKITLEYVSDGKFCGNGTITNLIIVKGACNNLDSTVPRVTVKAYLEETEVNLAEWQNGSITLKSTVEPATTTSGYTYQWYKDGEIIVGAITPDYTVTKENNPDNSKYTLKVMTGSGNSDTNSPLTIMNNTDVFTFSSGSITKYTGNQTDIVIPSVINGTPVTGIGYNTFQHKNLTSVVIPNSVVDIMFGAFAHNQLTSITIPSSITSMGAGAFTDNKLPDSKAFIYARTSTGTEDKTKVVSYGGAKRSDVVIPSSVTTIVDTAFMDNQLTSVTIPNSVTEIGWLAFSDNNLTSITIPSSVTTIVDSAFSNNPFTSVTIQGTATRFNSDWTLIGFPEALKP